MERSTPKQTTSVRRKRSRGEEDGTQMERDVNQQKHRHVKTRRKTGNPTMLIQMSHFCATCLAVGVQGLLKEFIAIKAATSKPPSELVKTAFDRNKDKNRYRDVFCLDDTRVVLTYPPGSKSDYIHANWVDVGNERHRFICTQAPKDNTVNDFWRMVWQEKSKYIIMLCNVIEYGKKKCEQYWPNIEGTTTAYGTLEVICNKVTQEESMLTVTRLTVTDGTENHIVEHIAWNNWPDRGVPSNFLAPFRLLQRIKHQRSVIIHCSAGIGRTGTIVGLDIMEHHFSAGEVVSMPEVVKELRKQRHGSVQTDIQYVYMHRCLLGLCENKRVVKRDEIAAFLKEFDELAISRGK